MRSKRGAILVTAAALACALGVVACGGSGPGAGRSHGIVQSLDPKARTLTLDHEDIPGLMKGMTMTFQVAPEVAMNGIEPGTAVDFEVREKGGVYTVTALRPSGR